MKCSCVFPLAIIFINLFTVYKGAARDFEDLKNHIANSKPFTAESATSRIQPLHYAEDPIIPWDYENIFGNIWDTSPFKAYKYKDVAFRLMFPNGYDSVANDGKKYPLILHFAGRGEAGEDNELQLRHAGQGHKKAIEEDRFPGYALFPQIHNVDGFATDNDLKKIVEIIELLIRDNKVDANRIYVHGLSAGGESTWRLIRDYPYLFAAALPMSWSHNKFVTNESVIKKYIHIPIWISQGGKDDFPPPAQTNNAVSKIRDKGGNIRYKYLPKAGHGTWTAMYTAPDFFPFMLRHSKLSIHVYHGQTSFCPGEPIDVTLGISLGFDGYEWQKDEQPFAAGATQNEIQVTEAGTYRVRFKRGSDWTVWSEPVVIDNNREVLPTLEISTNGKTRNLVTALDGSTSVTLTVPEGYQQYNWKKNNNAIAGDQTDSLLVSQAGSYTVGISEQGESALDENGVPRAERPEPPRCKSAFSAPVVVTVQDSPGTPTPPANFTVNTKTPFSLQIRWDDVANNELGYEIYRASQSGGPYTLVAITPPNIAEYADENLSDQTAYFYKARAVNTKGGSTYTPEKSATTGTDTNPPDAPASLTVTPVSPSQIGLTWNDKAFNEKGYKIFRSLSGSGPFDLIHTTAVNIASFTDTGLSGHTTYYYQVMAFNNIGESGKISSEGISTLNENPVITAIEPQTVKTGDTLTVTFTATDAEGDPITLETIHAPNFASFNDNGDGAGSLKIMPASSQAGFYAAQITAKDDYEGSSTTSLLLTVINSELTEAVYINFGSNNAAGAPWNNTAPSPVLNQTYNTFTNAHTGQTTLLQMKVRAGWNAEGMNGTTTQNNSGVFPDSVLAKGWQTSDSATLELSGLDPDLLYNFIFLGSKAGFDNGETAYYINGQKVVLDASRNVDNTIALNGIVPDAQGKVIISIVKSGASTKGYLNAMVIESYENGVPIQPTDLQATPGSRTQIRLHWNDQAGNEEGYEIYRATGAEGAFSLLTTTAANVNSFTDGELVSNTIYKYRVRASNSLGNSDYSNEVSASTLNQQILVNFNGSTHVMAAAPWNNTARTPTEGAVIPDLKDDQGNETNVDLVIENWETGFDNHLGLTTGDNSGVYPDAVLKTYYFLEPYDEPVRLVFTGLDPQLSYNFTFFGDGGSGAVSDELFQPGSDLRTQFIIGQDTVILNALDNTTKTVRINKVTPNAENAITVSIMAYEGATVETSAIFGIFNSIVVDGYYSENILMNNAPVITAVEDQSFEEGDTVSLQLQASDADGNPLAFSADNLPAGLNIDPVTGLISGIISEGAIDNSPYAVEVTVNDSLPVNNLTKITFNIQITETQIVCTTPTGLSAEPKTIGETGGALFSWTGNTAAFRYTLRYREVNSTTWEEVQTPGNGTQITIKSLAFDTEYEWNVQSLCAESVFSDTSVTQTFKTPTEPVVVCATPQNVSTEVISSEGAPNTVSVAWDAVSGVSKYEVEYSTDSINWTTLNSTETSVTLSELAKDTDYHVLVRSVCAEDGSVISDHTYISFNSGNWETPVCGTPENISYAFISGESGPDAVTITWDAVSTAMSYEIEYSTDSTNWTNLNSPENSLTLTELSENTKYHLLVRSVCAENMTSDHAYLTFNTGTFTEVCELPSNLTVVEQTPNDSTVEVTLTWEGPEGASFYYVLYAQKEAAGWEKMKVTNDTTALTALLPETTYRWAVITGCSSDETLISDTSSIAEFTTDSIDVVSGIGDDLEKLSFKVYPVPSQGAFTIEFKPSYTEKIQMIVYNVLGATMYQIEENTPEFIKEVNLPTAHPGVYFVKLIVGDRVYSKRILIQQE